MYARLKEGSEGAKTYRCDICDTTYNYEDHVKGESRYLDGFDLMEEIENRLGGDPVPYEQYHDQADDESHNCGYTYIEAHQQIVINLVIDTDDFGSPEHVWWCGNGCFHHDEGSQPESQTNEVWVCDECEEEFSTEEHGSNAKAAAGRCCQ